MTARRRPADDRKAQPARDQVDHRHGNQNEQDDECHLLPFEDADLLGQLQSDATGTDNADDGGRTRIGLEVVKHLARQNRDHLRQQPETYTVQVRTAG